MIHFGTRFYVTPRAECMTWIKNTRGRLSWPFHSNTKEDDQGAHAIFYLCMSHVLDPHLLFQGGVGYDGDCTALRCQRQHQGTRTTFGTVVPPKQLQPQFLLLRHTHDTMMYPKTVAASVFASATRSRQDDVQW